MTVFAGIHARLLGPVYMVTLSNNIDAADGSLVSRLQSVITSYNSIQHSGGIVVIGHVVTDPAHLPGLSVAFTNSMLGSLNVENAGSLLYALWYEYWALGYEIGNAWRDYNNLVNQMLAVDPNYAVGLPNMATVYNIVNNVNIQDINLHLPTPISLDNNLANHFVVTFNHTNVDISQIAEIYFNIYY